MASLEGQQMSEGTEKDAAFEKFQSDPFDRVHSDSGYSGSTFSIDASPKNPQNQPPLCHILHHINKNYADDSEGFDIDQLAQIMSALSMESLLSKTSSTSGDSEDDNIEVLLQQNFPQSAKCCLAVNGKTSGKEGEKCLSPVTLPAVGKAVDVRSRRCKSVPPEHQISRVRDSHIRRERSTSPSQKQLKTYRSKSQCKDSPDLGYDPTFEKSKTYLHGQGKNFSKAKQYLSPARPGLQKLTLSYTQTNMENNYHKIFMDLVKSAHKKNIIIDETVRNLERRLKLRREDHKRATSYYVNKGIKDPYRSTKKKQPARTMAEKKKERKQRIEKISEELKVGYTPTFKTMKTFSYEDMEKLKNCRYLRSYSDDEI